LDIINEHADSLIELLSSGYAKHLNLNEDAVKIIKENLKLNPQRATEIRSILDTNGAISYSNIWPNLQQLVIWTGGSCGITLSSLKSNLPPSAKVTELGYLSSEFRGTFTIDNDISVPTIESNFFEFIQRDDWESGYQNVKLIDELQACQQYYVIVTTQNGLYRYFMNDIVEAGASFNNTPTLRFIQKGRGVTNLTGEKLYENHTLKAVKSLEHTHKLSVRFQLWIADEEQSQYTVYLEPMNDINLSSEDCSVFLDSELSNTNIEYHQKRCSKRLKPLKVVYLKPGTADKLKRHNLEKGQREGQYKALSLIYRKDFQFPIEEYVIDRNQS